MGNSGWNPDRMDQLRSLSQAIARGASQVLQRPMRGGATSGHVPAQTRIGKGCGEYGNPLVPLIEPCEWCNEPRGKGKVRYCSDACGERAKADLIRNQRRAAHAWGSCKWCGHDMPPGKRADAKWCSGACARKARYIRSIGRVSARACVWCGEMFVPMRPEVQFCSMRCVRQREWSSGSRKPHRRRLTAARFDRMCR